MLIKRKSGDASRSKLQAVAAGLASGVIDRRTFLRQSGLTVGGLAALGSIQLGSVRQAQAAGSMVQNPQIRKNVCTHCSVGCTVTAEVVNGVWVGQEPSWDSPINRGTHCAKGASVRELVGGARRLKYPMKLVGGQWQRMAWDQAIAEIGDKLQELRGKHGADSVFWLGSAKFTNEAAYLFRKFGAYWGTNNVDHQARICHSTTVAGVANTWGYGAQTNSYNDIRNAQTMIIMGGNPAEAHPISVQHLLAGKEINRANMVVIDPRFSRTAAHATEYVRLRPGTDIPLLWGMLWHILQNGWEDKDFIAKRVYGFEEVRKEVAKYTPDEVEKITGVPGEQLKRVAQMFATQKPSTLIWCMGQTQHTVGTANVRASCIVLLATGNVGAPGTGANIFRGHTNVQGATDLGLDITTLPLYYGLTEAAWKHWGRVWETDYEWFQAQFDEVPAIAGRKARSRKENMEAPGITSTRWFDAVNLPEAEVDQRTGIKGLVVFGHGGNTVVRIPEAVKAVEKLELLVVADPHPTSFASMSDRKDNTYLLPICTSFEMDGSRTASNRSLQWGEQIVKPIFESKSDYEAMYLLAKKLGLADSMFKNIKVENNVPSAEDLLREINRGGWSTGYCGQSPERLKAHMKNQAKFDIVTLRAPKDAPEVGGDYYGLPWPCWGKPEIRHPGSAILYNTSLHVKDGGSPFRARFGVERNGETLLAEDSYSQGSELTDGYPEFTMGVLKKLGWDKDLRPDELAVIEKIGGNNVNSVSWAIDLSGGIQRVCLDHGVTHYGNGKARALAWNLPDP
ncbi:MAG TPA: molybdopterin-dependent oxidoreductase, partial [Enterovirga sp.]